MLLNNRRLRAWCIILAIGEAIWAALAIIQAALHLPGAGAELGADFTCYWAAGKFAAHGMAAAAYDPAALSAAEHAARTLPARGFFPFYYPPPALLFCVPLALLPYWPAVAAFVATGLALLLPALRRLAPANIGLLPLLAFPGVLVTAGTGQNGFYTAACFAWFAVWADRRPFLAGACLGVLACKPQLALCAPLALMFAGRWRSLAAAAATFVALCGASLLAFGTGPWRGFLHHAGDAGSTITGGMLDETKIMSVFIAARGLGAGLWAAGIAQAAVAMAALAVLAWFIRRRPGGGAEGGALAATALLVTPYLADYDLVCMAPALAAGAARGGNRVLLLAAYMVPLFARGVAHRTGLQIAPLAVAGLLIAIYWQRQGKEVFFFEKKNQKTFIC